MTIDEFQQHFGLRCEAAVKSERGMSNLDHSIDDGLEEELRANTLVLADYAALNFHGDVFFKDNQFHCFIMRHHQFQEIMSADTLKELMEKCSERYGYE